MLSTVVGLLGGETWMGGGGGEALTHCQIPFSNTRNIVLNCNISQLYQTPSGIGEEYGVMRFCLIIWSFFLSLSLFLSLCLCGELI